MAAAISARRANGFGGTLRALAYQLAKQDFCRWSAAPALISLPVTLAPTAQLV